jgi:RNA polymerase sigma factor (sigma-70 family)
MRQIRNPTLAELLAQLKFNPPRQRRRQLDAAEKLLAIVEKNKNGDYPLEFIWFKITGFRAKSALPQEIVKGAELAEDLRIFVWKLSGQVADPASQRAEKVYTTEHLARSLQVSTKTISRWRKRGLMTRKFVFEDGKKRLGFTQSGVDKFLADNPGVTEKAAHFSRLTAKEKKQIIRRAETLSARSNLSRYRIIETIASQTGRGHETIRAILADYQKAEPDKAAVIRPAASAISSADAAELYRLFKQRTPIRELMTRFNRSRSSTYRIIKQRRIKAVLARKIEFIQSDEFTGPDAEKDIPADAVAPELLVAAKSGERVKVAGSLADYLNSIKDVPTLNREQESALFRRYNYLKYLAANAKGEIKVSNVSSKLLDNIEKWLAEAEAIKKTIIEANLRLVVSIAGKHAAAEANLLDLVGEGNISLMHAVEKFDYTKGFRFATYASWVIMKDFARKIPAEAARPDRGASGPLPEVQWDLRATAAPAVAEVEKARHNLLEVIKDNLNEREQHIIINHFGLTGSLIRKNKKTLRQIGDDLGLTRERVRQIELAALQKLRQSLSPEEFELLTG